MKQEIKEKVYNAYLKAEQGKKLTKEDQDSINAWEKMRHGESIKWRQLDPRLRRGITTVVLLGLILMTAIITMLRG